MSTNSTNKRKRITIDTKVAIINVVDKQEKSNAQICRDFEIVSSTLYTILKDKDKILNAHASGDFPGERKKIRLQDFLQVDEAPFAPQTSDSVRHSYGGPQLMEKGKEISEGLGLASFSMSQGWLSWIDGRLDMESA